MCCTASLGDNDNPTFDGTFACAYDVKSRQR